MHAAFGGWYEFDPLWVEEAAGRGSAQLVGTDNGFFSQRKEEVVLFLVGFSVWILSRT